MVKDIYYQPYKFQYDSETKVLKSLNGLISISDVQEEDIDLTLEMAYSTFCPQMKMNLLCTYEALVNEYEMAQIF